MTPQTAVTATGEQRGHRARLLGCAAVLSPAASAREPEFRRFWAGQAVSLVGDQVSLIALPLVAVLVLDANAAQMGYLVAAELLPNLLFSLHAGAWADRRARKRDTMVATDLGRALLIGVDPARLRLRRAHVPAHARRRVPDGDADRPLPRLLQRVLPGARAARPARRGRLDHARQPRPLLRRRPEHRRPARAGDLGACDARRRRVLLRRLGALPHRVDVEEPATEAPGKGHVVAGVRWVFGNPIIRAALGATATINFFNFVFSALFILYATTELGVAPGTLGLVLGAAAVGGILGASSRAGSPAGSASGRRSRSGASSFPLRSCSSRSPRGRSG